MAENLDETLENQEPQENQESTLNERNLEIIDAGDITTVYSSEAKPVLNIKWDLENPLASEAGLASENGISNVSNSLVAGGFRRSEIDNIIGRNTSVFVSNVTTELYGNGSNAANQISSQQPRLILVRKRLIRIIDIWNRIIFGMNINARDNASMNRFFGANLQTNADVLFRNQISHTVSGTTFNETNSWTWLVNPDPSFIFSQVSRFLYACIFEIKEKIKLLNKIVEDAESNLDIEALGINNNTDTFNIQGNFSTTPYTSLLEPVHIIPDITHKIWNWSVEPTNANSKFQLLGAFAKHIPQKYSIMLFEPNFLVLLQELIDIIMDMPEEEHFSEIFNGLYMNPKDVKLIEVLVKELTGEATSESKIDFDSVHFTGIESIQNEPTKTSHIQFNDIYNFYLKYKNDFDFINETNAYNTKKKKYRYYEDVRVWDEQRTLRKEWEEQKRVYEESIKKGSEPVIGNLLVEYPLDTPNPENPESIPGPFVAGTVYVDTPHKYSDMDSSVTHMKSENYNPLVEEMYFGNMVGINNDENFNTSFTKIPTKSKNGYKLHLISSTRYEVTVTTLEFDEECNFLLKRSRKESGPFVTGGTYTKIGNKIMLVGSTNFDSYGAPRYITYDIDSDGELVNKTSTVSSGNLFHPYYNVGAYSVEVNGYFYIVGTEYITRFQINENYEVVNSNRLYYTIGMDVSNRAFFYFKDYIYTLPASDLKDVSIKVNPDGSLQPAKRAGVPAVITNEGYSFIAAVNNKVYTFYSTGSYKDNKKYIVSFEPVNGQLTNRTVIKEVPSTLETRDSFVLGNYIFSVGVNNITKLQTSGWAISNYSDYFIERKTYQGPTKPLPQVATWANTRNELPELRKYDFVDEPFMDNHLPYKDNPQYKFPITKNTEQINTLNTRFKNWIKLQKESYTNLDKLLTVFEYCSDLTSDVRYRSRWDHGKTKRARATHYDIGNRIDNIISLNISKLSTRLGIEYFKSLDNYNKKVHNKELDSNSPKPTPFFKNKIFSTEIYSGFNSGTSTVERNWKFGWSIVKFPKKFEISPKIDEIEATIVNGEKYIPCSWFSSGSSEILFPRQFIDTADEDDEMYIGFYNACTSFGVTAQMEELFRQMYPLLTGTEKMHGTSLVTINTLKPQIHVNFFKLAFIGDSTGKYFPDSQEELDVSPYGIDRESITKADIFVNIKADDDYLNKDEKFVESMDDEFDKPFVDSFKNIKIFYKLN